MLSLEEKKWLVGAPHLKARFVPKGAGLRTRWAGKDRRGVQSSHVPGCSATSMQVCPGVRKSQWDSTGSRQEATQLRLISRVGQPSPR